MAGFADPISERRPISFALTILGALAVSLICNTAQAASMLNRVSHFNGELGLGRCGAENSVSQSGSGTLSIGFTATGSGCSAGAASFAGRGVVGVQASNDVNSGAGLGVSGADANAETIITGLSLSAAAGFTMSQLANIYGDMIEVGLAPLLDASVEAQIAPSDARFVRSGSASLTATVVLRGSDGDQAGAFVTETASVNNVNTAPASVFVFAQPSVLSVMTGIDGTFGVTFRLDGDSNAQGFGDTSVDSNFRAFNSLGFNSDGPAFILPEGFTINAPEIGIVDNMWTDSRLSAVPLPAGFSLMLIGLAGLGLLRRRRTAA